jgi:inosine triphosphate pyrophosphatase
MIYFITGNKGKLAEAKEIIPELEGLDIDLPEIQEIDAEKVIEAKLLEARKHHSGEFVVEDTSLYFDAIPGLPGPLIKWFLKTIDNQGMADLVDKYGVNTGKAVNMLGYIDSNDKITYFEGSIDGKIVQPRGDNGFGWDMIFQPSGYEKTFAEMSQSEKNAISMRRMAFEKLAEALEK